MKVKIKRIDKTLDLPAYKTSGAVALDCSARIPVIVAPKTLAMVPLNVCIKLPVGHYVFLAARSSLPKRGLFMAHGVGIGDEDFCGNNDEYHAPIYNYTDQPVKIERGDRIAQMIIKQYEKVEWEEVDDLGGANRGGFGTTGK
ncbi:MAG: dUTP diphosphatase [bacterium]|nr:dUTP diphosphatase [bacterium]